MKRTKIVLAIGASVAAVSAFLALGAGSFATRWQPLGAGAWGGTAELALERMYHTVGLSLLCFGLVLLAVAAWNWVAAERAGPWRVRNATRPRWRQG
jgi:hypothetical protein